MSDGPFAILGLGLIGGSLARDLAADGAVVWGYDLDADTLHQARHEGVISDVIGSDFRALADAETVILAVPVDVAPVLLERAAPHLGGAALITDVGSTKQRIVTRAAAIGLAPRFVGSHPIAGDARAGWSASRRGLFAGARVDLCASDATPDAWHRAQTLWQRVGGRPCARDARGHDAELALSSHLPQLLALALAGALQARGVPREQLGPGGTEMTRLAASSPDMWTAILDENAAHVTDAIDTCQASLGALRGAVARHDQAAVREVFAKAHAWMAGARDAARTLESAGEATIAGGRR